MKISVGSDHRGYPVKERVKTMLTEMGHEVADLGCGNMDSCDYPDQAVPVAESVARGEQDRGILVCGTGLGMSITANKVAKVRAALCHDELTAEMSRKHNDANVLCLPADLVGDRLMERIIMTWLKTSFEGGRHARRVGKISAYEHDSRPQS